MKDLVFTQKALSIDNNIISEGDTKIYPNPMFSNTELSFYSEVQTKSKIEIYSITGALLKKINMETTYGNNKVTIERNRLKSGLYFVNISNNFRVYKTKKLIVN